MARRYVIVGMGATGIAAAEAIRAADGAGEIVMVSDDPHGYYSRPGLAYYLTDELPEKALFPFSAADTARLGLRRVQDRAVALDPAAHRLVLAVGDSLAYDRLLLATGSLAVPAEVPGAELEGVVKLDDLEDARQILKQARRARAAVVVGGGITALEIVEGLHARRVHTHYFIRRERYWSNVLDEDESRIVEERLRRQGVHLHYHTELAAILGRGGRVAAVQTEAGERIDCDMVAVAIGVRPRLELATAAGLRIDRAVLVDEHLASSQADVFAAGDVAQVFDPQAGRAMLDTLWTSAVPQGRAAGQNMAGQMTAHRKAVACNVTRLAGLTTTIIGAVSQGRGGETPGIARGDSETWRQAPDALAVQSGFEVNHLRLMVGERALLGAIIMGDQAPSRPLQQLIAAQADVSSIRDQLLQPGAPLGALIAGFWTDWRERHATP